MTEVAHALAWIAIMMIAVLVFQLARRRSPLLAGIFAAAIALRVLLGVGLFVISMYELPIFRGLQSGGGFWTLAIDAKWYYDEAANATRVGLGTIQDTWASPLYLRVFAAWLAVAGITPLSGVLFNLLCYIGVSFIIVTLCPSPRAGATALAAVTLSPALLIFGSQPLKDPFCLLLIATALAGARLWCEGIDPLDSRPLRRLSAGLMLTAAAVYGLGGVRAYAAVFVIIAIIAAGAVMAIRVRGSVARGRVVLGYTVLVSVLVVAFYRGAGPYAEPYDTMLRRIVNVPTAPIADLDRARAGFVNTGGATSLGESAPAESISGMQLEAGVGLLARLGATLRGLAALLIPISLLKALSIVSFSGGRGLLLITDLDTIVIDLSLAACVYVLIAMRPRSNAIAVLVCVAVFTLLMTFALAYVVTNYGTLFRLRLMAVAPIWLMPALLRPAAPADAKNAATASSLCVG